ncbi:hypothetical protein A2U01_0032845, partial [Trifolium medium]|nr:hypothetical protein [Trifolium medium]
NRCWHNNLDGCDDHIAKVFQGEGGMHPLGQHHTKLHRDTSGQWK